MLSSGIITFVATRRVVLFDPVESITTPTTGLLSRTEGLAESNLTNVIRVRTTQPVTHTTERVPRPKLTRGMVRPLRVIGTDELVPLWTRGSRTETRNRPITSSRINEINEKKEVRT